MQKLAKKFIKVMAECSHIAKNGTNNFHNYKYATSADVLEKVNNALTQNGIASIVTPELLNLQDVTTNKGNIEHLATVKIEIMLIDTDSGESLKLMGLGSGQDSGDKAVMKAQTAAIKYAYLLSLAISTGDDPEADKTTDEVMTAPQQASKSNTVTKTNNKASNTNEFCHDCGVKITKRVAEFSIDKYGLPLCMECQKDNKATA